MCPHRLVGTQTTTAGTPSYMAPELLKNGLFSKSVDTYAFAVVLWEMFVRAVPYGSWDAYDVRRCVLPRHCHVITDACDVRRRVLSGERLQMPRH